MDPKPERLKTTYRDADGVARPKLHDEGWTIDLDGIKAWSMTADGALAMWQRIAAARRAKAEGGAS